MILLQLMVTENSDLRSIILIFSAKKKDMNTDKLAINWQNFARVLASA